MQPVDISCDHQIEIAISTFCICNSVFQPDNDEEDSKETTTFLQHYMSLSESTSTPMPGRDEELLSNPDDDESDSTNPANFLNSFLNLTSNPGTVGYIALVFYLKPIVLFLH